MVSSQVQQVEVTPEKMRAAMRRAAENAKTRAVWRDKGPVYTSASNAQEGE